MTDRFVVSDASVLAFAPHIVFRFDEVRKRWVILAPERLMLPDEQAVEILQLVDGKTGVGAIVDSLARASNGELSLADAPGGGLAVTVTFALATPTTGES